jgi:MOSC domain-containing protein YiiM
MLQPGALVTAWRATRGIIVTVTNLFIKRAHRARLDAVSRLAFTPNGIAGGVRCSPLRQVLVTSRAVNRALGLQAGDLRENVVIDLDGLYDLPSGSVIRVGEALVRLTFHCEPCRKMLHLVAFDDAVHKRGFLGAFLNRGTIAVGDAVAVTAERHEAIPYAVKDRLRWFLGRNDAGLAAGELAHALGLPGVYARALPRMVEKLSGTRRLPK